MRKTSKEPEQAAGKDPKKVFRDAKDKSENALLEVAAVIRQRRLEPDPSSYTSRIVNDREKIAAKVMEECGELLEAETKKDVVWEAADLMYVVLVYLENRAVEITEVLDELMRRRTSKKDGQRYSPIPD